MVKSPQRTARPGLWASVALLAVVLLAYAPWTPRTFAGFDDASYIRDNPHLRSVDGLRRIWFTLESEQYYPLTFTSYWVEYHLWGAWANGYYFTNVLLHVCSTVLVLQLARRLGLGWAAATFAAAIFALHPIQVASVAWLAERKNVLSGVLALAAANLYLLSGKSGRRLTYLACLGFFAGGLLAKTAIMTLAASLPLADVLLLRLGWRRAALRGLPMLALAGTAAFITIIVEHSSPTFAVEPALRPLAAAGALWFYISKIVWPWPLLAFYALWTVDAHIWSWWAALAATILVGGGALLLRKRMGGLLTWGVAHFVLTLLPVLGLIPFGYLELAPVADHFVYLALLGLALPAARGLELAIAPASTRARNVGNAGMVAICLTWAVLTHRQAATWAEPLRLFSQVLEHNPTCGPAHQNMGFLRFHRGEYEAAVMHYGQFVAAFPKISSARSDLGAALMELGRMPEAIAQLQAVCDLNKADGLARLNLGTALARSGRMSEAEREFAAGVALAPGQTRGRMNWAIALNELGRRQEAEEQFRAALRLAPNDSLIASSFADALAGWGRRAEALTQAQTALALARQHGEAALARQLTQKITMWQQTGAGP